MNKRTKERDREIRKLERQMLIAIAAEGRQVNRRELYAEMANHTAPRFYTAHQQTCLQVGKILCGRPLTRCQSRRMRECYEEISRRTAQLLSTHRRMTLEEAVSIVMEQPAPNFYLSERHIQRIVNSCQSA